MWVSQCVCGCVWVCACMCVCVCVCVCVFRGEVLVLPFFSKSILNVRKFCVSTVLHWSYQWLQIKIKKIISWTLQYVKWHSSFTFSYKLLIADWQRSLVNSSCWSKDPQAPFDYHWTRPMGLEQMSKYFSLSRFHTRVKECECVKCCIPYSFICLFQTINNIICYQCIICNL
jgi:hypothetical protein